MFCEQPSSTPGPADGATFRKFREDLPFDAGSRLVKAGGDAWPGCGQRLLFLPDPARPGRIGALLLADELGRLLAVHQGDALMPQNCLEDRADEIGSRKLVDAEHAPRPTQLRIELLTVNG